VFVAFERGPDFKRSLFFFFFFFFGAHIVFDVCVRARAFACVVISSTTYKRKKSHQIGKKK
jgi:hypothetical protein